MIICRFVYKFASGGTSDSLNQEYPVSAVPRVGDAIFFSNNEGNSSKSEVLEVAHSINTETKKHEIIVYHGESK